MKISFLSLSLMLGAVAWTAWAADPVPPQIQNLVSAQRPGTFLVDITYDLVDPDSKTVYISVEASSNGGSTYALPITSISGDVGHVAPGTARKIVWNAWDNWAGNYTANARVRLVADDTASLLPQPPSDPPTANLVWIPPGSFVMNPPNGPKVWISKGFWMGKYEVRQSEFQSVMGSNPSNWKGSSLPVESVTWTEAVDYCQRLTTRERTAGRLPTGWSYRLPREAEWEYACRAGTTTKYSFGNDITRMGAYAWYDANSGGGRTHAVGTLGANRWGLHDMHGNVWEWCSDWFADLPGGNLTDPKGPTQGSDRVFRGGGWRSPASECQSTQRGYYIPWGADEEDYIGFRVILAPIQ